MVKQSTSHIDARAGFTLLEVLVAVALSAVALMALFAMFDGVTDVSSSIIEAEKRGYSQRAFEALLFDDLRSVAAGNGTDFRFQGQSGSFLGIDGQLMGFCSSASLASVGDAPSFGLNRVEYLLKEGEVEQDLYRRERPYCGLLGDWEWVEVPVLRAVKEVTLEYMRASDGSYASEWTVPGYPRSVRLRITFADGREQQLLLDLSSMTIRDALT